MNEAAFYIIVVESMARLRHKNGADASGLLKEDTDRPQNAIGQNAICE